MATSKTKTKIKRKKLMVAAIDFGTTYSGWAYSFYHDYKSDPTKVSCKQWNSGKHFSMKAPTTVLIQPDGCTMEAFGYEAEDRYAELVDEGEHLTYYYFQQFKMMLFDNRNLSRKDELEDDKGKRLPAKRIFSMVIKYLRDDLLEESEKKLSGAVYEDEIQWVLTVPAIWNPLAKLFMRECAIEAGIKSANLLIALEPEAASLYCKYLTIQKKKEGNDDEDIMGSFNAGARYMVVDAGGGTVDIVVHEVCSNGTLKEIYKANGGDWGGTRVDKAFFDLLDNIVGDTVMKKFKDEHRDDFLDLQREFEVKKRNINPDIKSKIKFKLPVSLSEIYTQTNNESIMEKVKRDGTFDGKVNFRADKVLFENGLIKELFNTTTEKVVQHLQKILQEKSTLNIKTILMVGGFSESPMLFEAVRSAFPQQNVLLPQDAGLSVLKGAVIFGHDEKDITVRISPYTYGFKMFQPFNPTIHPKNRMAVSETGEQEVRGCFKNLIEVGDQILATTTSKRTSCRPCTGEMSFGLRLYASPNPNPLFVDAPGCFMLGEIEVDCKGDDEKAEEAEVFLSFGDTEFEVHGILKSTGRDTKATLSFLD